MERRWSKSCARQRKSGHSRRRSVSRGRAGRRNKASVAEEAASDTKAAKETAPVRTCAQGGDAQTRVASMQSQLQDLKTMTPVEHQPLKAESHASNAQLGFAYDAPIRLGRLRCSACVHANARCPKTKGLVAGAAFTFCASNIAQPVQLTMLGI